jgi:DNA-binding Xre family transcriptional regulator
MERHMVVIKLREAILAYKRGTGERMTYRILAERTGIAEGTLEVMGSRTDYNATIHTLEKICLVLDVTFGELLEIVPDAPKAKRAAGRKRGGA